MVKLRGLGTLLQLPSSRQRNEEKNNEPNRAKGCSPRLDNAAYLLRKVHEEHNSDDKHQPNIEQERIDEAQHQFPLDG